MTPFKCPACDGYGKRERKPGGKRKKCRACQGSCIVWDSAPTYRPAPYYWHNPYWYHNGIPWTVLCSSDTATTTATIAYNGDLSAASTSIVDVGGYTTDLSTASWTVS